MDTLELDYRPQTYFGPRSLLEYQVAEVKGAVVRERLERLLDEGNVDEVKALLDNEGVSAPVLKAMEWMHPMLMGGNYLPNKDDGEVEIARIEIASTTHDVTCTFAKTYEGKIHYRVVDEYDGDTLSGPSEMVSDYPLSLREMADFFLQAWSLFEVLEMNFEGDLDQSLDFFVAKSSFYSNFDRLCRERVKGAFPEQEGGHEDR